MQNVPNRGPKLSAKMHLENLPKNMQKSLQIWSKNGRESGPKRSRGVPGGPKSSKIRFPGPWGVQGGSRGAPRRSRRHNMSQKSKKKTGDSLRADFGRFLGDFWSILERFWGPGGQKAGLKRYRFSGTKKSRIFTKFSSKFESKKEHDFDTFQYTL